MVFDPGSLTWRCDVCKDERPDAQISVYTSEPKQSSVSGVQVVQNIKYCNDKQECIDKAPLINLFGKGD